MIREPTILRHFIEELEQLKTKLLEMSAIVESSIQRSISAVTQKDRNAAEEVFRTEARINAIEIEIDEFAINLLALQQPMAADLRLIVAALKINTDLERMGDLAVSIAERALSLMEGPIITPMIDIPHIAGLVQSMVRKALDAFVHRDADLARSVLASDDAVDSLRTACYHELTSFMEKDPQQHSAGAQSDGGDPQPGAHRRPLHQHRRRRAVPGERDRRPASRRNPPFGRGLIAGLPASFTAPRERLRAAEAVAPRLARKPPTSECPFPPSLAPLGCSRLRPPPAPWEARS